MTPDVSANGEDSRTAGSQARVGGEARMRALLEAAVDGIISIDGRGTSKRSIPPPSGCSAMRPMK